MSLSLTYNVDLSSLDLIVVWLHFGWIQYLGYTLFSRMLQGDIVYDTEPILRQRVPCDWACSPFMCVGFFQVLQLPPTVQRHAVQLPIGVSDCLPLFVSPVIGVPCLLSNGIWDLLQHPSDTYAQDNGWIEMLMWIKKLVKELKESKVNTGLTFIRWSQTQLPMFAR